MELHPKAEHIARHIRNPAVRQAFLHVDRALFVPPHLQASAWEDHPLPIEESVTISQPSLVTKMTELLQLNHSSRVLEVGTGSGYQTALLAKLAAEVYTIEINPALSKHAQARLDTLGYSNIHFRINNGALGWTDAAPFDAIIATAAFRERPERLLMQLAQNGICVAPVGNDLAGQWLVQYRNTNDKISARRLFPVRFLTME